MTKQVIITSWDNGFTVEYHKEDAEGNDKLHQEVVATKAALRIKLAEVFKDE